MQIIIEIPLLCESGMRVPCYVTQCLVCYQIPFFTSRVSYMCIN